MHDEGSGRFIAADVEGIVVLQLGRKQTLRGVLPADGAAPTLDGARTDGGGVGVVGGGEWAAMDHAGRDADAGGRAVEDDAAGAMQPVEVGRVEGPLIGIADLVRLEVDGVCERGVQAEVGHLVDRESNHNGGWAENLIPQRLVGLEDALSYHFKLIDAKQARVSAARAGFVAATGGKANTATGLNFRKPPHVGVADPWREHVAPCAPIYAFRERVDEVRAALTEFNDDRSGARALLSEALEDGGGKFFGDLVRSCGGRGSCDYHYVVAAHLGEDGDGD